ncbi:hypothetical protein ABT009_08130 [Streptomyces sp. NPDC002896]|uniref:hypothetical protein n=1 Tax=Streptomyces sp. NPDC002896 TaxID=3154438 RepID=UPI003324A5EA
MRMRTALRAPALAVTLLALGTSCADHQATSVPEPPAAGPADLLVGVREIPGTPSPQIMRALPRLSLYGDGRAITPSGREGALQTATVHRLTDERVRELYEDAYTTAHAAVESPDVVDGGVLALTVRGTKDGRTGASRTTPDTRELPLQADGIADFRSRTDPSGWPDEAFRSGPRPYAPTALAVFATPADEADAHSAAWPYDDPGRTGTPTREGRCTVLAAGQSRTAQRLARAATPDTVWRAPGGRTYRLDFRPLLPDEKDCRDLGDPGR